MREETHKKQDTEIKECLNDLGNRLTILSRAQRKVDRFHRAHPELTCPCCGGNDIVGFHQGSSLQVHCMNPQCGLEGVTLGRAQWQALTLDDIASYSSMNERRRARCLAELTGAIS